MLRRLSWLLSILIYLSVNGQVIALPTHQCDAETMEHSGHFERAEYSVLSEALNNQDASFIAKHSVHHQIKVQGMASSQVDHELKMNNGCYCNDCDHHNSASYNVSFLVTTYNPALIYQIEEDPPIFYQAMTVKSTTLSNLYRPPILA